MAKTFRAVAWQGKCFSNGRIISLNSARKSLNKWWRLNLPFSLNWCSSTRRYRINLRDSEKVTAQTDTGPFPFPFWNVPKDQSESIRRKKWNRTRRGDENEFIEIHANDYAGGKKCDIANVTKISRCLRMIIMMISQRIFKLRLLCKHHGPFPFSSLPPY